MYTGAAAVIDFAPRRSSRLADKPRVRWDSESHEPLRNADVESERDIDVEVPRAQTYGDSTQEAIQGDQATRTVSRAQTYRERNASRAQTYGDNTQEAIQDDQLTSTIPRAQTYQEENTTPTSVLVTSDLGMPMPGSLRGRYDEDSFFRQVLQKPNEYKDFIVEKGLVYLQTAGHRVLCIPDIVIGSRRIREIIIKHAHSVLAHLGARKTLMYLRDEVWWKGMVGDVAAYCKSCGVCATGKSATTQPMGLLRTLPVPSRPWQSIGIDFIGPLPESTTLSGAYDMICVVIDHLTLMVHLIPTRQTYGAIQIAEVVFEHVYKLHGLSEKIISDRDMLFTSTFWTHLHKLMNTELRLSSAYHPQTDGATERANRTMTQMLRQCVRPDQKDWASRLPAIELAMNTARSDTTGFSPF